MIDSMDDFLDFGDPNCIDVSASDQFADEYANLNRCEGSPSSEDVDLSPLANSVSMLSTTTSQVDVDMNDFALGRAPVGHPWAGIRESFPQMNVKASSGDVNAKLIREIMAIPGSWPGATTRRPTVKPTSLQNQAPAVQTSQLPQPTSFTMSQIAPPSLPQERSKSTATSSICSEVIKEEESVSTEPPRKRRASETLPKLPTSSRTGHKRSTSNASALAKPDPPSPAISTSVDLDLDESGDPITAKRQDRLMRNRAAALASRERKREHVTKLESCVQDLENERDELTSQMSTMNNEISRLRGLLQDHGIDDEGCQDFEMKSSEAIEDEFSPECDVPDGNPESAAVAKTRPRPTGFSPRGALKKFEILANQRRAEAHLRDVTMKQAALNPNTSRKKRSESSRTNMTEATTASGNKHKSGGGSAVFMILIFGIALFASTTPTGTLDLTGISTDAKSPGLVLNLPSNLRDACPESIISRLRDQGFKLPSELDLESLSLSSDLSEVSLPQDSRTSGGVLLQTGFSDSITPEWTAIGNGAESPLRHGSKFTIFAIDRKSDSNFPGIAAETGRKKRLTCKVIDEQDL